MSKTCDPQSHQGHMCVLVSEKRFDRIQKLVRDANYVCFNCGRVAHAAENLCNPMPLSAGADAAPQS